jgi:hypothetical protein
VSRAIDTVVGGLAFVAGVGLTLLTVAVWVG